MAWNVRHVFSVGEVATSANVNNNFANSDYIPHEWDYAQITAGVSIAGTSEGTATTIITGNSVTYDGSRVKIEAWLPVANVWSGATVNLLDYFAVVLRDSTVLGQAQILYKTATNGGAANVGTGGIGKVELFDTPSAAAHTYSVKVYVDNTIAANNLPQIVAGPGGSGQQLPAWLRVTAAKSNP